MTTKKKSSRGPSELENLYLAVFADFGWLYERVQDGRDVDGSKAFQGYGLVLGLMTWSLWDAPAVFSFGYAYSPQSEKNRHGVLFSSINYRF